MACHSRGGRYTGIDLVDVYIGKEEVHLRLHKKLLCARCPFFKAALTGDLKEAHSNIVKLPEDSVEAFNVVVAWVYSDAVPTRATKPVMCDAYRLAEKLLIPGLQNDIIDVLNKGIKANKKEVPDPLLMAQLYRDLDDEHPLLSFWREWVVYSLWNERTHASTYAEAFAESPSFALYVISKLTLSTFRFEMEGYDTPPPDMFEYTSDKWHVEVSSEDED